MISFKQVTKQFGDSTILKNISCDIAQGEFVSLVGESGCGKTTLLRLLAGLELPTDGVILFANEKVKTPHKDRGIVFQDFALFPWLTVQENIGFGLKMNGYCEGTTNDIVEKYLDITGLKSHKDAYPSMLSGGMKQRVAIARTLANNPKLICMDEPFGALDVMTRNKMQTFLSELWEKEKKTVVFVTHDIEEALFLSDRVLILDKEEKGIKAEYTVPFERPRSAELKYDQKFIEMKKEIGKVIEN